MLHNNQLEVILENLKEIQYLSNSLLDKVNFCELDKNIPWQNEIQENGLSTIIIDYLWTFDELIQFLQKKVDKRKLERKPHYVTRYQIHKHKNKAFYKFFPNKK